MITAPLFPYTGTAFMIQTEDENPQKAIEDFVSNDPYVKAKFVTDYKIREFAMTDKSTEFERIAAKFLVRN